MFWVLLFDSALEVLDGLLRRLGHRPDTEVHQLHRGNGDDARQDCQSEDPADQIEWAHFSSFVGSIIGEEISAMMKT